MPESPHDITPESEQPEHEHEHGEGDHAHKHVPGGDGVLEITRGCGDNCAKCLNCRAKPQTSASVGGTPSEMDMNTMSNGTERLGG